MTADAVSSSRRCRRSRVLGRLLSDCCVIGVAAVLVSVHGRGDAQTAFQGSPTIASGSVSIFQGGIDPGTGATLDTITSNGGMAVIDWTPTDTSAPGSIDFLPSGTIARFDSLGQNYTVLNRINPTDGNSVPLLDQIIEFNGRIESMIGQGSTATPGGNVWFYTPGGFLVGSGAVIDVGGLALSTSQIDPASTFDGVGGTLRFTGAPTSTSAIAVTPGASITANVTNGYVAMVAPRIIQAGSVDVDGSTAYVAAEAADISINAGLFDIVVTTGSDDPNGIDHSGTTTGPASQSAPPAIDAQRIYMVAVPKNQAMTMLLSGDIGYQPAASATAESSAVILSAGNDIVNGAVGPGSGGSTGGDASIVMSGGTFSNQVSAGATGSIFATPTGSLQFGGSVDLKAVNAVVVDATQGSDISVTGNLAIGAGDGINGGAVVIDASGTGVGAGAISVSGTLSVDASGNGDTGIVSPPATGANATGGGIALSASGDASIGASQFIARADAQGGSGTTTSGNSSGGGISVSTANNATISFASSQLSASALRSADSAGIPATGGDAHGGTISITASGGALSLGDVALSATAAGNHATTGASGDGVGGIITIDISGGTHGWNTLFADVDSTGGDTDTGTFGAALPASSLASPGVTDISLLVSGNGTTLDINGIAIFDAGAFGQIGGTSGSGAQGGIIGITASSGGTLNALGGLAVNAAAQTQTGNGAPGNNSAPAQGGQIDIVAAGGTLDALYLDLDATGQAGFANNVAADAFGGTITVSATSIGGQRGLLNFGSCPAGVCIQNIMKASASGASANSGGNATGGTLHLFANDADITSVGEILIGADGIAGYSSGSSGLPGGNGQGGAVIVEIQSGTSNDGSITADDIQASALGSATINVEGISFNGGDGGNGTGGTIDITLPVGTLTANSLIANADGFGGSAAAQSSFSATTPFTSGNGLGGTAQFTLSGGTANIGTLFFAANGEAGHTESGSISLDIPSTPGTGTGGTVRFSGTGGSLNVTTALFAADGSGGLAHDGFDVDGAASGTGIGGAAFFDLSGGAVSGNQITVSATGMGGQGGRAVDFSSVPTLTLAGGDGGDGVGGSATLSLSGGSLTTSLFKIGADGLGGAGGNNESLGTAGAGGNGTGGSASLAIASAGHAIGDLQLSGSGRGGDGGTAEVIVGFDPVTFEPVYAPGPGAGGSAGDGAGGSALLQIDAVTSLSTLAVNAGGTGGTGGSGAIGGQGGNGTGGSGGNGAQLLISNGALSISGQSAIASRGVGGQGGTGFVGRGGDGGDGFGGDARLDAVNATTVNLATTTISGDGVGGTGGAGAVQAGNDADGTDGGGGTGGGASLNISGNAAVTINGATGVSAGGFGATGNAGVLSTLSGVNGGAGGDGTGGIARIAINTGGSLSEGSTPVTLSLHAQGIGGHGAAGAGATSQGGIAGNGAGGSALADLASGGSLSVSNWSASVHADGGFGGSGGTATNGGQATGGTIAVTATGAATTIALGGYNFDASANGGDAGVPASGGASGANGGNAAGGDASLTLGTGSAMTVGGNGRLSGDSLGGDGSAGVSGATGGDGGNGGSGDGGNVSIALNGGSLRDGSGSGLLLSSTGHGGLGGAGGNASGVAAGGNGGAGGDATGGAAQFSAQDADYDINDLVMRANATGGDGASGGTGTGGAGTAGTGGGSAGGIVTLANAATTAPAIGEQRTVRGLTMEASGLFVATGGPATGGTANLFNNSPTAGAIDLSTASVSITAAGQQNIPGTAGVYLDLTNGVVSAFDMSLQSDSLLSINADGTGGLNVGGFLFGFGNDGIDITHGNRPAGAPDTVTAGNDIDLSSAGPIDASGATTLRAGGSIFALSQFADVTIANAGAGVNGGTGVIDLVGLTGVSADMLSATSDILLRADSGAILVATDLQSGGLVSADALSIAITSGTDIAFDHAIATNGNFFLTAGGVAGFVNAGSATNIDITAADLDIQSSGSLTATGDIALTNGDATRTTVLGGAGASGAFSLDASEIGRLSATNISFMAPQVSGSTPALGSASTPDLLIDGFTVAAGTSGPIAPTGQFSVTTSGKARVGGAVTFTGLSGGGFAVQAGGALEIIAGSGAIDLQDANGGLGGTLSLSSSRIAAGSIAVINAVAAAGTTAQRDAALGTNDGAVIAAGHIQADSIDISVSGGVYIQNSGAASDFDSRRGFTANTLAINTAGSNTDIVISGRFSDPVSGGFVTGIPAMGLVQINGGQSGQAGYATGSTINGCLIANPASCSGVAPHHPHITEIPTRDEDVTRTLNPETAASGDSRPVVIIELKEFEQLGFPPLIDEPVTGSGNDDLWVSDDCSTPDGASCATGAAR